MGRDEQRPSVVLVRPDGHIAWRLDPGSPRNDADASSLWAEGLLRDALKQATGS
jgi:hypothetical protein